MTYIKLLFLYIRLGILGELEYRANFWVQILESCLSLVVALGGLLVIFNHTDSLGGWLPDQLIALIGIYIIMGALIGFIISPSMEKFTQDVRKGTLDFVLMKPVDGQFLVSIQQVRLWKLIDVVVGMIVLGVGIGRMSTQIGPAQALTFLLALITGSIIIYSFWIILAATSFWIIRAENIFQLFNSLFIAARWPIQIYPKWLNLMLTFVVPIAFAVTIPAEGLIGTLTTQRLLLAMSIALGLSIIARFVWKLGLRNYSGASA